MAEIYTLSVTQLMVLLKGAGYNSVSGFTAGSTVLDDESVIRSLHAMSKSGLLTLHGDSFEMIPALKEAVRRIGSVEKMMILRTGDGELPDKCIYPGEKWLVCTARLSDKNHLSMCFMTPQELFDELADEGYLPKSGDDKLFSEEELIDYETDLFSFLKRDSALERNSCILLSIDYITRDQTPTPYLRVIDYYFYYYILYSDGSKAHRAPYRPETFKEYYERMLTL